MSPTTATVAKATKIDPPGGLCHHICPCFLGLLFPAIWSSCPIILSSVGVNAFAVNKCTPFHWSHSQTVAMLPPFPFSWWCHLARQQQWIDQHFIMMSVIVCIALRQPNSDESFKNIILIASCLIVMIWLVLVINLARVIATMLPTSMHCTSSTYNSGLCSADVLNADGWITITNKDMTGKQENTLESRGLLIDPRRNALWDIVKTIEVKRKGCWHKW